MLLSQAWDHSLQTFSSFLRLVATPGQEFPPTSRPVQGQTDTFHDRINEPRLRLFENRTALTSPLARGRTDFKLVSARNPQVEEGQIEKILGTSYVSPMNGKAVKDVRGVVTRLKGNAGFFIQGTSDNPLARNGIFVYTGRLDPAIRVGDLVSVNGIVNTYQPRRMYQSPHTVNHNLTSVQIQMTSVRVLLHMSPLPMPVVLHKNHCNIPEQIFTKEAPAGLVETPTVPFDPHTDALAALKSLQGKLVTIKDAVVVEASSQSGHFVVMSESMIPEDLKTPEGGVKLIEGQKYHPARFYVYSAEKLNVGDKIRGPLTGVLDFSARGMFCIEPTRDFTIKKRPLQFRQTTLGPSADHLRMASLNVENLSLKDDTKNGPNRFNRLAEIIVGQALAPDIITLLEVHSDPKDETTKTLSANATLDRLVAAITEAGGPQYAYRYVNPEAHQDGGKTGGNIRTVFLYRTDNPERLQIIDSGKPGPKAATAPRLDDDGKIVGLTHSPGRIKPRSKRFTNSRKPLAGHFVFNGHDVFVVGHHLRSKKGDFLRLGKIQPPTPVSEPIQIAQAKASRSLAEQISKNDPEAKIIYLGDFNAYEDSKTLDVLTHDNLFFNSSTVYTGRNPKLLGSSFIFRGLSGNLDHILHSAWLMAHAQPEFDVLSENPNLHEGHEKRSGDHGMVLARYYLPAAS